MKLISAKVARFVFSSTKTDNRWCPSCCDEMLDTSNSGEYIVIDSLTLHRFIPPPTTYHYTHIFCTCSCYGSTLYCKPPGWGIKSQGYLCQWGVYAWSSHFPMKYGVDVTKIGTEQNTHTFIHYPHIYYNDNIVIFKFLSIICSFSIKVFF